MSSQSPTKSDTEFPKPLFSTSHRQLDFSVAFVGAVIATFRVVVCRFVGALIAAFRGLSAPFVGALAGAFRC